MCTFCVVRVCSVSYISSGGKKLCFILMCKPPQDLAHQNKKRHLFSGEKGAFCVFVLEKKHLWTHSKPCCQNDLL